MLKNSWLTRSHSRMALDRTGGLQGICMNIRREVADPCRKLRDQLNLNPDELQEYNKWVRRGTIPTDKVYTVIIPGAVPSRRYDRPESDRNSKSPNYND
jgi:hypothetical protein